MKRLVLKGTICYSVTPQKMKTMEQGWVLCEDGICKGAVETLPESWAHAEVCDYGEQLIIPAFTDLHIHAPQYAFRGMGMDLELLDWLNEQAFPEEARYRDLEYADRAYTIFAENLKRGATTRACVFATMHREATELLMEKLEQTGICAMVGKVNMDRNSPDSLREKDAETAAEDTAAWLKDTAAKRASGEWKHVTPVLTPRFIPSCSDELMRRLGKIRREYRVPVQSHLSENPEEIRWVRELCPESEFYGDAYDRFGLFGGGDCRTVMAHCVYSGEREQERMKERGVWIAHCPQSNMNLSSGIAPVREFLERGLHVGLGSDVAGGSSDSIFRAITDAIQVSKLRWRMVDGTKKPLTFPEGFYLATKGGGSFFGQVGSFEDGYELDALVLDDSSLKTPRKLTPQQRLERICYLADERQIAAKYVAGEEIRLND